MIVRTAVVVIGVALVAAELSLNPVRGSEAEIRQWLLKLAPLGSSFADVKALIEKKKWSAQQEGWGGEDARVLKGVHWVQAKVGEPSFPSFCHARATWGFDDEKLVDVYVERWCEGM